MKTKKIVLGCALLWVCSLSLSAQVLVSINKTITQDTLLTTIQKNNISSKAVVASGQTVFSSKSGYVRILLSDEYGYDLLVYESSPLVAANGIDNFNSVSLETFDIPADLALTKVRVEIKNAELKNLSIDISDKKLSRTQQQKTKTDRIALINKNLRAQDALWGAGETSISQMSYQEKKGLFGGTVPDLAGFDYYVSGIYVMPDYNPNNALLNSTTSSQFASEFDWRNRHGRNWTTPAKDQGYDCFSCWVFSSVGTIEAYTNLYYNQLLNLDLSEQEVVSCSGRGCKDGPPSTTLAYSKNTGIVNESCFMYQGSVLACTDKCSGPDEKIKIENYSYLSVHDNTPDSLKKMIVKSPMTFGVISWKHLLGLVGYKTIQAGDSIYIRTLTEDRWVKITPGSPYIGSNAWILKNSWGTDWGENGFGYLVTNWDWMNVFGIDYIFGRITSLKHTDADIVCEDRDGDGYYYWGIGPKPATCPSCAPNEPDGDDSNPNLGPMDEYGNCAVITPLVDNISTSQIWSTNRTLCKNTVIQSGITLTISSATVFSSNHTITIQNGGKLILLGGIIDDGYIVAQSGSELTIKNNGKVLLGNYNDFDIQLGAVFNLEYGEVSLK